MMRLVYAAPWLYAAVTTLICASAISAATRSCSRLAAASISCCMLWVIFLPLEPNAAVNPERAFSRAIGLNGLFGVLLHAHDHVSFVTAACLLSVDLINIPAALQMKPTEGFRAHKVIARCVGEPRNLTAQFCFDTHRRTTRG